MQKCNINQNCHVLQNSENCNSNFKLIIDKTTFCSSQ